VGEVPPLTELYEKYRSRGFAFFIVYVREAHPGENFPHHASFEKKLEHAEKLREVENVNEIPILIDDIHGTTHRAYGLLPNMVYLIDREGTVVYKSDWSDADELDGVCTGLLRFTLGRNESGPNSDHSPRYFRTAPLDSYGSVHAREDYRRSGEKAIQDYLNAKGNLPYATDAERKKSESSDHSGNSRGLEESSRRCFVTRFVARR